MSKLAAFAIDESIEMTCSACHREQSHKIQAVTKQGKITEAVCEVCGTVSTFTRGVKTSTSAGNGSSDSSEA